MMLSLITSLREGSESKKFSDEACLPGDSTSTVHGVGKVGVAAEEESWAGLSEQELTACLSSDA